MVTDPSAHPWSQPPETAPAYCVVGWRYMEVELAYEQRTVLGGGPLTFFALAGASAVGNRRRRHEAARLAAPQWRPLGGIAVVIDDARLLVHHQGAWASVWLDAITALEGHPGGDGVALLFADDPPYAFTGPWAGRLASVIDSALAARRPRPAPLWQITTTRSVADWCPWNRTRTSGTPWRRPGWRASSWSLP